MCILLALSGPHCMLACLVCFGGPCDKLPLIPLWMDAIVMGAPLWLYVTGIVMYDSSFRHCEAGVWTGYGCLREGRMTRGWNSESEPRAKAFL